MLSFVLALLALLATQCAAQSFVGTWRDGDNRTIYLCQPSPGVLQGTYNEIAFIDATVSGNVAIGTMYSSLREQDTSSCYVRSFRWDLIADLQWGGSWDCIDGSQSNTWAATRISNTVPTSQCAAQASTGSLAGSFRAGDSTFDIAVEFSDRDEPSQGTYEASYELGGIRFYEQGEVYLGGRIVNGRVVSNCGVTVARDVLSLSTNGQLDRFLWQTGPNALTNQDLLSLNPAVHSTIRNAQRLSSGGDPKRNAGITTGQCQGPTLPPNAPPPPPGPGTPPPPPGPGTPPPPPGPGTPPPPPGPGTPPPPPPGERVLDIPAILNRLHSFTSSIEARPRIDPGSFRIPHNHPRSHLFIVHGALPASRSNTLSTNPYFDTTYYYSNSFSSSASLACSMAMVLLLCSVALLL